MDITTLQSFATHPVALAAAGGAVTLGLGYAFNRWSGKTDIVRNAGGILRRAEDYATHVGLDAAAVAKAPLPLAGLRSLFIANAETASMTLVGDDGTPAFATVRLDSDSGMVALRKARGHFDAPERVFDLLARQIDTTALPKDLCKEATQPCRNWSRPRAWRAVWALVARDSEYESRANAIRLPLNTTAKALAASPEAAVDLGGRCHIALKIPVENDPKNRADIIVMPTFGNEWNLIADIESGTRRLENGARTPKAMRDALVEVNRPLAHRIHLALKAG